MELIKREIGNQIGKRVVFKANRGRKRYITRKGVIESVYPSLFAIRVEHKDKPDRTITFTYSDVLTNTVQLKLYE